MKERERATSNNNITSFGVSVFCLFVSHFFTLMKHTHYTQTLAHTNTLTHREQNRGTVALEHIVFANSHGIVVYACIDYYFSFSFLSRIPAHFFHLFFGSFKLGAMRVRSLARSHFLTSFFPSPLCGVCVCVNTFLTFIALVLSRDKTQMN